MAGKRGDIGSKVVGGIAAMVAAFTARKLTAMVWTRAIGKEPPAHPEDPQEVRLVEALSWAVATGIVVETARLLATRETTKRMHAGADTKK